MFKSLSLVAVCLGLAACIAGSAAGNTVQWNAGTTGAWFDSANWSLDGVSPAGPPTASDDADLTASMAQISIHPYPAGAPTQTAAVARNLYLGGAISSLSLNTSAPGGTAASVSLTTSNLYIGYGGVMNMFSQTADNSYTASNSTTNLYVGGSPAGYGRGAYIIGSGSVGSPSSESLTVAAANVYVGYDGDGTIKQTSAASTHTITNDLAMGVSDHAYGSYTMFGGTLSIGGSITSGSGGTSELIINGGSVSVGGDITVDALTLDYTSGGQFTQFGHTYTVRDSLTVGGGDGTASTYRLQGGLLNVSKADVGDDSAGKIDIADSSATMTVASLLRFGQNGSFAAAHGAVVHMAGADLQNESTSASAMAGLRNVTLMFEGGSSYTSSLEIAGTDKGAVLEGLNDNFAIDTLKIGGAQLGKVMLADNFDNQADGSSGNEVLYVERLILENGSTLDLNGLKLYYEFLTDNGGTVIANGGELIEVPEPMTSALLLLGSAAVVGRRRRRGLTR